MGHPPAGYEPTPSPRRPYLRTMQWWWLKESSYRVYMVRELTAAAVTVFAIEVLAGLIALANGPQAWGHWLGFLAHPIGMLLNLIVLALLVFHAWSWFDIMPKTMPPIVINGSRVDDAVITRGGQAVFVVLTVVIVLISSL